MVDLNLHFSPSIYVDQIEFLDEPGHFDGHVQLQEQHLHIHRKDQILA